MNCRPSNLCGRSKEVPPRKEENARTEGDDMSASFVTQQIDYIESEVYKRIKPLGFRKHGRTLHRFVSGDISQVISFQCGQAYLDATHLMWVNIGIRIPECTERRFDAVNSRIFSVELCYGNRASMTGKDCFRGKRICKRRVVLYNGRRKVRSSPCCSVLLSMAPPFSPVPP